MQHINTAYATYFNIKYNRKGHLFEGRFKAYVVQKGEKLKAVTQYIHMNPIRAKMVENLKQYAWSSHNQYIGTTDKGPAEPEHVLSLFGDKLAAAVKRYEEYMASSPVLSKQRNKLGIYGDYVLGEEDYVRKINLFFKNVNLSDEIIQKTSLKKFYEPEAILSAVSGHYGIARMQVVSEKGKWNQAKRHLIYLLKEDCGLSMSEIGRLLKLHHSGVGKVYRKMLLATYKDTGLRKNLRLIRTRYDIIFGDKRVESA